jgi:hypothetical protein
MSSVFKIMRKRISERIRKTINIWCRGSFEWLRWWRIFLKLVYHSTYLAWNYYWIKVKIFGFCSNVSLIPEDIFFDFNFNSDFAGAGVGIRFWRLMQFASRNTFLLMSLLAWREKWIVRTILRSIRIY